MQKYAFVKNFINFRVPKNTSRDPHKTRKPLFPQMQTTKPLKKLKIDFFRKIFMKSPVSPMVPKTLKQPSMLAKRFVFSKN